MLIELKRYLDSDVQTVGKVEVFVDEVKQMSCVSLELPWKDNQHDISCIPEGVYEIRPFNSVKFGHCFQVMDVPDRDYILIHKGNYNRDTHGCILLGSSFSDIDKDGNQDVISSKVTVEKLVKLWDGFGQISITHT